MVLEARAKQVNADYGREQQAMAAYLQTGE
jgi:hypothetical protein